MDHMFGIDVQLLWGIVTLLLFVLVIMILVIWIQLFKMKKKYKRMMNGVATGSNLEELLLLIQSKLAGIETKSEHLDKELEWVIARLQKMQSKVGVYRYNAFGQQGSDLSFSIAFLNDLADGVVISGIHNREDTYIYAKPLEKGQSSYPLTPEEKRIIDQTLRPQNSEEKRHMEKAGGIA